MFGKSRPLECLLVLKMIERDDVTRITGFPRTVPDFDMTVAVKFS